MKTNRESGECIEHIGCDACGSSDAQAVYESEGGSINGYCWSCNTYHPDPYKDGKPRSTKKPKQLHAMTVEDVSKLPTVALQDRKIKEEHLAYFGVKMAVSCSDGVTVTDHYYPVTVKGKISGYKKRRVSNKTFGSVGKIGHADLFGYNQANDNGGLTLFITEGELDCVAVFQALKDGQTNPKYKHLNPAVVSLPNGVSSAVKIVDQHSSFIANFKKIVLIFDQDQPGQQAVEALCKVLPMDKVVVAELSENDPCDMLKAGKQGPLRTAVLFNPQRKVPSGVKKVADLFDDALDDVAWGRPWPWPKVTEMTYGRRRGELYMFGAGSGVGKSECFKELIEQDLKDGLPVGVIFLEEPGKRTLKVLAGKRVNKRFHVPGAGWTKAELRAELERMREEDLINLYDSNGVKDWDELKQKIRYWVTVDGIKDIYLDHLTALVAGADNERLDLDKMLKEMASLCEELDFTFYVISHLTRPGQGRKAHEEGGKVKQADFRGSGAIAFWSHFMFSIERNTQASTPEKRNKVKLRCLKDRYTGNSTGVVVDLYYNPDTGRLLQDDREPEDDDNEDEKAY